MANEIILIGSAAAADLLDVSRSTLQRLVTRGRLVPVTRGNGRRGGMTFNLADVLALATKTEYLGQLFTAAGVIHNRDDDTWRASTIVSDVNAPRRDGSTDAAAVG